MTDVLPEKLILLLERGSVQQHGDGMDTIPVVIHDGVAEALGWEIVAECDDVV